MCCAYMSIYMLDVHAIYVYIWELWYSTYVYYLYGNVLCDAMYSQKNSDIRVLL